MVSCSDRRSGRSGLSLALRDAELLRTEVAATGVSEDITAVDLAGRSVPVQNTSKAFVC
jgi:hypothetical protein